MAGSLNKVTLIGNLGNEPEIRSTQDGKEIANFSMATTESWKDKMTGERKDRTEWHRVVVFNSGLVNVIKQYVHKGSKLYIEGALQTRKWTDQSGQERYTTEVVLQAFNGNLVMLDSKQSSGGGDYVAAGGGNNYSANPATNQAQAAPTTNHKVAEPAAAVDDEIPF